MQKFSKMYVDSIENWRINNPKGRKIDCMKELNFSYATICKYWSYSGENLSAKSKVISWRKQYPEGIKIRCMEDTGLSFPTVSKYWNLSV